ncbi:MAG: amino acid ABC transporter substrate-binding protein [Gemmatimonadetes bacterium]|nr:amino acid ABC transporter substrate-binding protein [Gemmatimonadota bacterium]MYG21483.1 amino acid ABC transporter substrate-binding protein [Gemmatimonadota bacterium]MYJ38091.1 amino acid ABC transporter substrate-binding protein [Gemmatimonadota bacterium]
MTDRPRMTLLIATLFAGRLVGCASGGAESEPPAASGPLPADAEEAAVAGDTVVAVGWVEGMLDAGEFEAVATALVGMPAESVTGNVLDELEAAVAGVSRRDLMALAEVADDWTDDDPRIGPLFAELAVRHAFVGDTRRAQARARRVVGAGSEGEALRTAEAVLRAELSDVVDQWPVVGAILPESGSPANREYARLFAEGMEVAAVMARRAGVRVELLLEDNQGTRSGSVRAVSALVSRGASAILGPLSDENLEAAAGAAPNRVALLSPTARRLPPRRSGVYTIGAGDPGAGRTLAQATAQLGYVDAVVVHPDSPEGTLEATSFEDGFFEFGGVVTRRLPYIPGTTTYAQELQQVESLAPQLLVVAAPPGDVVLLAPQIAFFGLDTLDIQVAGTAGWTAAPVLESVDIRHTNRVIAVSTTLPDAPNDPAAEFRAAYEEHFRRTLRSPVPAAGFDLFRMVLDAHGQMRRGSRGLGDALDRLRLFEGATATYSVVDGRLVREYFPVRIYNRELHHVGTDPAPPPGPGR